MNKAKSKSIVANLIVVWLLVMSAPMVLAGSHGMRASTQTGNSGQHRRCKPVRIWR